MSSSSRFGDLTEEVFITPRRARRNFKIIQATITNLKQKNGPLLRKVETLNDEIKRKMPYI